MHSEPAVKVLAEVVRLPGTDKEGGNSGEPRGKTMLAPGDAGIQKTLSDVQARRKEIGGANATAL